MTVLLLLLLQFNYNMCCGRGVTYQNSAPAVFERRVGGSTKGVIKVDNPEHPLYLAKPKQEKNTTSPALPITPVNGASGPLPNDIEPKDD